MDIKNPQDWSNAATTVIAVASVLANFVAPTSPIGRVIHLIAFNLRKPEQKPPCPPQPPKLL